MAQKSAVINVMIRAADRAARGLKRDFGEVENLQVSKKGPADFVSTADLKSEQVLRQELHKARPDYAFLMEESGSHKGASGSDRRWVVDPLDGTINFLHGIPHFAVSIALEEAGEVIAGVVYDPIKEDLFYAEKGVGAYLNDRRIRVSSRTKLTESMLATGLTGLTRDPDASIMSELPAIMAGGSSIRRLGSAALDLAYVAAGRYEGFWDRGLGAWDIAAGQLLVREAGGYVTTIEGKPLLLDSETLLAANANLHGTLSKILTESVTREAETST